MDASNGLINIDSWQDLIIKPEGKAIFNNDVKAVFKNAWKLKAFTKDSNYMYMYSCEGFDYFKHSLERTYISVENNNTNGGI